MRQRRESSTRAPRSAIPLRSNSQKETMFLSLRTNSKKKKEKLHGVWSPEARPRPSPLHSPGQTVHPERLPNHPPAADFGKVAPRNMELWGRGAKTWRKKITSIHIGGGSARVGSARRTRTHRNKTQESVEYTIRDRNNDRKVCVCVCVLFFTPTAI